MTTTATAPLSSLWTQQYALAVAGAADASSTCSSSSSNTQASDSVQRFLASALAAASSSSALAAIGAQLLVPVAQLGTAQLQKEQQLSRDAALRVLQLQVICRLFCCCAKNKKTKKKKQQQQPDVARLKKETRGLLDRVALLLGAANPNPPSLTDDDEHSPFHEFLQEVLAPAFAPRLPKFTKFLLGVYELEDEARELESLALQPLVPLPAASKPAAQTAREAKAPAAQSILSALRDEQRPLKRSRTETAVPFKKMQLPNELRRRSSFPSTRRALTDAVAKAGTTADSAARTNGITTSSSSNKDKAPDNAAASSASASNANASSTSKPSSKVRRSVSSGGKNPVTSAEKPRLAHHVSLGAKPTTLLRNIDRTLFAAQRRSPLLANAPASGLQRSLSGPKPPTAPHRTAISALLKNEQSASVVMRTPDRPHRRQQRTSRVLIESSPPFRNPNVGTAVRQRKPPSSIPPPQLR